MKTRISILHCTYFIYPFFCTSFWPILDLKSVQIAISTSKRSLIITVFLVVHSAYIILYVNNWTKVKGGSFPSDFLKRYRREGKTFEQMVVIIYFFIFPQFAVCWLGVFMRITRKGRHSKSLISNRVYKVFSKTWKICG